MRKYLILGLSLFILLTAPALAQTDNNVLIAQLRAKIQQLTAQLQALLNQSSGSGNIAWCHDFNQNLGVGAGGPINNTGPTKVTDDVSALYWALGQHEGLFDYDHVAQPGTAGSSSRTTSFTEQLASAVTQFQEKYADEILRPNGLVRGTGYVGVATRRVLNRLYGCNNSGSDKRLPVINGVSGPTVLNVGQSGTWTVQAIDPKNGPLAYSVIWGDETAVNSGSNTFRDVSSAQAQQTTTFTHSYALAGDYDIYFAVTDKIGHKATKLVSVRVGDTSQMPIIKVITPRESETLFLGSNYLITWKHEPNLTPVDIYIMKDYCHGQGPCITMPMTPVPIIKGLEKANSYWWNVGQILTDGAVANSLEAGYYRIRICQAGLSYCGLSDVFKISDAGGSNLPPTIGMITGPTYLTLGETGTWQIYAKDPENGPLTYAVTWGDETSSRPADDSTSAEGTTQQSGFTHSYNVGGNYTVSFQVYDNAGNKAKSTITVQVGNVPN